MKINIDEDVRAYQLRKSEEKSDQSGLKWFFIIAFGVFVGNSASFGLERAVLYWELSQVVKATSAAMAETSRNIAIKSAEQRKISEAQARQRQIEQDKKRAGYRQAMETCTFWRQQVMNENTSQNRMHRDQACALANQFR